MANNKKTLTAAQETYVKRMAENVELLRQAAGLSQWQFSEYVGMSRPSYSLVLKTKQLSWRNFLAWVFFFDNHAKTHDMLRELNIYPEQFLKEIKADYDKE